MGKGPVGCLGTKSPETEAFLQMNAQNFNVPEMKMCKTKSCYHCCSAKLGELKTFGGGRISLQEMPKLNTSNGSELKHATAERRSTTKGSGVMFPGESYKITLK